MTNPKDLIDQLTATGDYKVIRRLKPVERHVGQDGGDDPTLRGPCLRGVENVPVQIARFQP